MIATLLLISINILIILHIYKAEGDPVHPATSDEFSRKPWCLFEDETHQNALKRIQQRSCGSLPRVLCGVVHLSSLFFLVSTIFLGVVPVSKLLSSKIGKEK